MATDLTVRPTDTPGAMAGACEALGNAGINIDGCCAYPAGTAGQLHLLVETPGQRRAALSAAGYEVVQDRSVIVHELEDGRSARRAASGRCRREPGAVTSPTLLGVETSRARLVGGGCRRGSCRRRRRSSPGRPRGS